VVNDLIRSQETPAAFSRIDFKNFSYSTNLRGRIALKDGTYRYENPQGGAGDTFTFYGVSYLDLTGDGADEAVVGLLAVSCGGSCDGGSLLFYFYESRRNKLRLITRLETGSLAYDCGLKSFSLIGSKLTLELFRTCDFRGSSFQVLEDADMYGGKFQAQSFTRFLFKFDKNSFALKKREVLPFPPGDAKNYSQRSRFATTSRIGFDDR